MIDRQRSTREFVWWWWWWRRAESTLGLRTRWTTIMRLAHRRDMTAWSREQIITVEIAIAASLKSILCLLFSQCSWRMNRVMCSYIDSITHHQLEQLRLRDTRQRRITAYSPSRRRESKSVINEWTIRLMMGGATTVGTCTLHFLWVGVQVVQEWL